MKDYIKGQIVRVAGIPGPRMKVIETHGTGDHVFVVCVWFSDDEKLQREPFPEESLMLVKTVEQVEAEIAALAL